MNWALFGASTIASQYMIDAIRGQGGRIGWVVSGDAVHAAAYRAKHEIGHWSTAILEALEDPGIEAVYISSTNDKHHAQAMAAIGAGKHVLCEKPLALDPSQAREMIAAAQEAGVTLAVNHHLRSAGSHRAIRDLIAKGAVGRVLSVRVFHAVELPVHLRGWRLDDPKAGGGVIPDLTVHNADTVRAALGEDPVSVVAEMAATGLGKGVEDSAMSVWTMPSGAMVFSHESFTHPHAESGLEVHGTDGSILARGIMAQEPVGEVTLVNAERRTPVEYDKGGLYAAVIRDFEGAVAQGRAPHASGEDGLKSLLIARAVLAAAQSGTRQMIEYGDKK
ncbi:Gfo/Idh/MocA family protein [Sagittula salina]|uniref:Gfo/Idh/MocA family oxidoreductase n=1 Tax=Sagittula salina TaxID=2820268 RepID=A0A940MRA8_9RHOB|nr:Gfo/Idh/MocA family oxidoreductase [Sagittula salina]